MWTIKTSSRIRDMQAVAVNMTCVFGVFAVVLLGRAATLPEVQSRLKNENAFSVHFIDKTMRVDYFHSGGQGTEVFGLDRVVSDGPWAGSLTRLVDGLNLGKYLFEVVDLQEKQVI